MSNSKKDHIALPAQTLRRFRENGEPDFAFIDVTTGAIGTEGPSKYQRIKGYYQEDYDSKVRVLEDKLGKVADSIIQIAESNEDALYDRESLKDFVITLIAMQSHRRPELKDAAMEADRLTKLIDDLEISMLRMGIINKKVVNRADEYREMLKSEKTMRDYYYERTDMKLPRIVQKLGLYKLGATFMKVPNDIQTTFLLTPFHYIQSGQGWFFTITPRLAIALLPINRFDDTGEQAGIWEVGDEQNMDILLEHCIKMAKQCNPPHLIGERYTLEKVKKLIGVE